MAIDPRYIPAFSIETVILDKDTGAPLSGGFVYFEQDNNRGVLKPVYQITGTSPNYTYTQLPNPMELSSIGTFQDSLDDPTVPYFFPYDGDDNPEYYYVRVTDSTDGPQFAREAVPYIADSGSPGTNSTNFSNEISNPQFSEVLFDTVSSSYVYNFSGATLESIEIAPNWSIVVTGTGTVTVSQTKPVGSLNRPTNPGTLLNINSTGISVLRLRQRIYGSPNLFGSGYLSGFFVAKTFGSSATTLSMLYSQSSGTVVDETIVAGILPANGEYVERSGSMLIPASNSSDNFPDAYVDIDLVLPLNTNIEVTSVQVVATGEQSVSAVPYDQESNYRQIDHLFHYFLPELAYKPIPSLLTAWDFPLNPAQPRGSSVTMNTTAAYLWDQTIGKSVVGNIAVVRNAVSGGIQATTANASEAFYYLQYLSGNQAKKMLGTKLAVNVSAFRTQAGGDTTVRVYLYRGSSAATFPTLSTTIGTIAASGVFTLTASDWTLIPRGNLGQALGTLSVVNTGDYATLNDAEDLQFSGWEITDATEISDTDKFAIVVTYECPTTATVVTTNSISVVPGEIPTRPAPQSADEVIRECQYYYETSKDTGVTITAGTVNGALLRSQGFGQTGGTVSMYAKAFGFQFKTNKRTQSSITRLYTPGGTADQVLGALFNGTTTLGTTAFSDTSWSAVNEGTSGILYTVNTTVALYNGGIAGLVGATTDSYILFHYETDDRLGIV